MLTILRREIDILKVINHPNLLRCIDILQSEKNLYIITEYCKEVTYRIYIN